MTDLRTCLRQPIPEIALAAKLLDEAVSAHISGDFTAASALLVASNLFVVRNWTESLWGAKSIYAPKRLGMRSSGGRLSERMPHHCNSGSFMYVTGITVGSVASPSSARRYASAFGAPTQIYRSGAGEMSNNTLHCKQCGRSTIIFSLTPRVARTNSTILLLRAPLATMHEWIARWRKQGWRIREVDPRYRRHGMVWNASLHMRSDYRRSQNVSQPVHFFQIEAIFRNRSMIMLADS
jgi:hypothetical protein